MKTELSKCPHIWVRWTECLHCGRRKVRPHMNTIKRYVVAWGGELRAHGAGEVMLSKDVLKVLDSKESIIKKLRKRLRERA